MVSPDEQATALLQNRVQSKVEKGSEDWLPVSLKLGQDQDAAVGAFGARHRPDQV